MDQGEVTDGSVIAPPRDRLSPARALLLVLGAVLGGVVLSLALSSSPAHAADGNEAPHDPNPLATATQSVTSTTVSSTISGAVSSTARTSIPAVEQAIQHTMDASAATVVTAAPVVTPVVAPAVTSVEATVASTLSAAATMVQRLTAPAAGALEPFALAGSAPSAGSAAAGTAVHPRANANADAGAGGASSADLRAAQGGPAAGGALPGSLARSTSSVSPAAVGVLLAAFALVLLAARRRVIQRPLPSSPVFDTDTSPA